MLWLACTMALAHTNHATIGYLLSLLSIPTLCYGVCQTTRRICDMLCAATAIVLCATACVFVLIDFVAATAWYLSSHLINSFAAADVIQHARGLSTANLLLFSMTLLPCAGGMENDDPSSSASSRPPLFSGIATDYLVWTIAMGG